MVTYTGKDRLSYSVNNGTLTIRGSTTYKDITAIDSGVLTLQDNSTVNLSNQFTTLIIGKEIVSICDNAFYGTALRYFAYIGSDSLALESVGDYAFASTALWAFHSGNKVPNLTHIGEGALMRTSITQLEIPVGVTTIPDKLCQNCSDLLTIVKYDASGVMHSDVLSDITSIGSAAFAFCTKLRGALVNNKPIGLSFPDVVSVGSQAFYSDSALTSISLPKVETIGSSAFTSCSVLANVTLGQDITTIEQAAFLQCVKLALIYFEAVPTTIGSGAFSIQNQSTAPCLVKSPGNSMNGMLDNSGSYFTYKAIEEYTGKDGLTYYFANNVLTISGTGTMSSLYTGILTLEDNTTMNLKSMTSCVIESGVQSIRSWAFRNCKALTSVSIPDTVLTIPSGSFGGCSSLATITISQNNPNYVVIDNVIFNSSVTTLVCCAGAKTGVYTVPNTVTSFESDAFMGCEYLTSISVPSNITEIPSGLFEECISLTTFTIPSSVTKLGARAFYHCASLTSIVIPNSITEIKINTFNSCTSLQAITLHNGITSIGSSVFSGCRSLETINLPEIATIESYTFMGCTSLESITIPDTVTSIGQSVFDGCSALETIVIPKGVASIGSYAFYRCSSLEEITLPLENNILPTSNIWTGCTNVQRVTISKCSLSAYDGYTSETIQNLPWQLSKAVFTTLTFTSDCEMVPKYVFKDCASLTTVNFANTITKIGDYAFRNCTSLTSGPPASLLEIGYYAMTNTAIQSLNIPNVTTIQGGAFDGNTSLTTITIPISIPAAGRFSGCTNVTSVIFMPGEGYNYDSSSYLTTPWYLSRDKLTNITFVTTSDGGTVSYVSKIGSYTFAGCNKLRTISLQSQGITARSPSIYNQHCFDGCSSLTSCSLSNATQIGDYAFCGSGLVTVTVPAITSAYFGNYVFKDCSSLQSASIYYDSLASHVNYLSVGTFENCTSLRTVNLSVDGSYASWRIPSRTFYGCTALTYVPGISNYGQIGESAFEGCIELQNITFERQCVIEASAFNGCYNVRNVTFKGNWVNPSMGVAAFSLGVDGHTVVAWASSVGNWAEGVLTGQIIGSYTTFQFISPEILGNDGLVYQFENHVLTVVNPDSTPKSMTALQGVTLTPAQGNPYNIGTYVDEVIITERITAIYNTILSDRNRSMITLGSDLTTIGSEVFRNCKFATVKYLSNTLSVGNSAFRDGVALQHLMPISINPSTEEETINTSASLSIGERSFEGCTGLTDLSEMGNITSIGVRAFMNCTGLTEFESNDITVIPSLAFSGCTSLDTLTLDEGLEEIESRAFQQNTALTAVVLPQSLETLGDNAFYMCGDLETVHIGSSLYDIGVSVFHECPSLREITIDSNNQAYKIYNGGMYTVNNSVLYRYPPARNGTSVSFPSGLVRISEYAFEDAVNLTEIVLPSDINIIKMGAFRGCTGLTSMAIPAAANTVENSLFDGCYSLTEITFEGERAYDLTDAAFTLGRSGHTVVCTVKSPNNWVSSVATEHPNTYTTLTFVGLYYRAVDGLIYRYYVNANDKKTLEITIPSGESYTTITALNMGRVETTSGNYMDYSDMEVAELDNNITTIGNFAFGGCSHLENISLPTSLTLIGSSAFSGCSSLLSLILPVSLTALSPGACQGCYSLTEIYIPQNVTYIGSDAFRGCYSISKIVFLGDRPSTIGDYAFALGTSEHYAIASVQSFTGWTLEEV